MALLVRDIERLQRKASRENMTLAIRLNGTSDIQWEKQYPIGWANYRRRWLPEHQQNCNIFEIFPNVQFYDYTKIPGRTVPANYHLTFSYSGVAAFQPVVDKQLRHNPRTNLAVVFSGKLPTAWHADMLPIGPRLWRAGIGSRRVINGDNSDVRYQDPDRSIVGLTAKGKAKNDTSGFVVAGA